MVLEMATLIIDPAEAEAFEAAVASCVPLFQAARGCREVALEREVEESSRYLLRIEWESIDDHMIHFRQSPEFQLWRSSVGPFFKAAPVVVHHEPVLAPHTSPTAEGDQTEARMARIKPIPLPSRMPVIIGHNGGRT